jgi:hypothetical protein
MVTASSFTWSLRFRSIYLSFPGIGEIMKSILFAAALLFTSAGFAANETDRFTGYYKVLSVNSEVMAMPASESLIWVGAIDDKKLNLVYAGTSWPDHTPVEFKCKNNECKHRKSLWKSVKLKWAGDGVLILEEGESSFVLTRATAAEIALPSNPTVPGEPQPPAGGDEWTDLPTF